MVNNGFFEGFKFALLTAFSSECVDVVFCHKDDCVWLRVLSWMRPPAVTASNFCFCIGHRSSWLNGSVCITSLSGWGFRFPADGAEAPRGMDSVGRLEAPTESAIKAVEFSDMFTPEGRFRFHRGVGLDHHLGRDGSPSFV